MKSRTCKAEHEKQNTIRTQGRAIICSSHELHNYAALRKHVNKTNRLLMNQSSSQHCRTVCCYFLLRLNEVNARDRLYWYQRQLSLPYYTINHISCRSLIYCHSSIQNLFMSYNHQSGFDHLTTKSLNIASFR